MFLLIYMYFSLSSKDLFDKKYNKIITSADLNIPSKCQYYSTLLNLCKKIHHKKIEQNNNCSIYIDMLSKLSCKKDYY